MKLTKSKLKELIKEELALMGALEVENNFIKKHDHDLNEEASDELVDELRQIKARLLVLMNDANEAERYGVAKGLERSVGSIEEAISDLVYS